MAGKVGGRPGTRPAKHSPFLDKLGLYVAVAFEVPSTILGGLLVGYFLDRYLGTSPWLLIALTFTAFTGACVRLVRWARYFQKRARNDNSRPGNDRSY
ncbi:MAG: AtpZ/AtpI family protein [Deltaproteobacteria bacterium]|nr:AtpZ/AtpI family protein [Deltaproteobacteria bacterium]